VHLDDRRVRWLLFAALVLVGAGFYAFVVRGSSGPKDPTLGKAGPTTTEPLGPPGDPTRVPLAGFGELAITVDPPTAGGDTLAWCLLAALSGAQRSQGLMATNSLQGYSGMAFVYPMDVSNPYYMFNTLIPLSIAWIDSSGNIVSTADMTPCTTSADKCLRYHAAGPYRMAIEVPQGQLASLGLVPGSHTTMSGACAPRRS
jgi:uncharacterized membrane protein (UPF0127 family)